MSAPGGGGVLGWVKADGRQTYRQALNNRSGG